MDNSKGKVQLYLRSENIIVAEDFPSSTWLKMTQRKLRRLV